MIRIEAELQLLGLSASDFEANPAYKEAFKTGVAAVIDEIEASNIKNVRVNNTNWVNKSKWDDPTATPTTMPTASMPPTWAPTARPSFNITIHPTAYDNSTDSTSYSETSASGRRLLGARRGLKHADDKIDVRFAIQEGVETAGFASAQGLWRHIVGELTSAVLDGSLEQKLTNMSLFENITLNASAYRVPDNYTRTVVYEPTSEPTPIPTSEPTPLPTMVPTSSAPTVPPTPAPSPVPTSSQPTMVPTPAPSPVPTPVPTFNPFVLATTTSTFLFWGLNEWQFDHEVQGIFVDALKASIELITLDGQVSYTNVTSYFAPFDPSQAPTPSPTDVPTGVPSYAPTGAPEEDLFDDDGYEVTTGEGSYSYEFTDDGPQFYSSFSYFFTSPSFAPTTWSPNTSTPTWGTVAPTAVPTAVVWTDAGSNSTNSTTNSTKNNTAGPSFAPTWAHGNSTFAPTYVADHSATALPTAYRPS